MAGYTISTALLRSNTIKHLERTKTVSFVGGVCLLVNSMTGAGIPYTPATYAAAGVLPPLLLHILFGLISTFATLFTVEAIQAIPGNKNFQGLVEYSTLLHFYFDPFTHMLGQFTLYAAIMSQAIQSIVISSQTFDAMLLQLFGKTCGLAIRPPLPGNPIMAFYCVDPSSAFNSIVSNSTATVSSLTNSTAAATASSSPFGNVFMLITLGFLLTFLLALPLAFLPLEDNINVQIVAFCITVCILSQWVISSLLSGIDTKRIPIWNTGSGGGGGVLGPVILNFAGTVFVPSWINLKHKNVNAQATVYTTTLLAVTLYTILLLFPAFAYPLSPSSSVLPVLTTQGIPLFLSRLTSYLFSMVMLLPSIPVSFVVCQNNLVQNGIMSNNWARVVCQILPWLLALPMLSGEILGTVINWTGLLFVSPANFVLPFVIYLKMVHFRKGYNSRRELSQTQRTLLKTIHPFSKTIHAALDSTPFPTTTSATAPQDPRPSLSSDDNLRPSSTLIRRGLRRPTIVQKSPPAKQTSTKGAPAFINSFQTFWKTIWTPSLPSTSQEHSGVYVPMSKLVNSAGEEETDTRKLSSETVEMGEEEELFELEAEDLVDSHLEEEGGDVKRMQTIQIQGGEHWRVPRFDVQRLDSEQSDEVEEEREVGMVTLARPRGGVGVRAPRFEVMSQGDNVVEEPPAEEQIQSPRTVDFQVKSESQNTLQPLAPPSFQILPENSTSKPQHQDSTLQRPSTLPRHPHFVTPPFRSIPAWVPVDPYWIALGLCALTIGVTVVNIGMAAANR
ncbi:hypothetical protein HDV05_007159 [Chytridiales sp. JEL 0842]|nr:hypothetical protein HDV05_007159 [Chytridiales sp. JEL 0842]